jgi:hypothetical protein
VTVANLQEGETFLLRRHRLIDDSKRCWNPAGDDPKHAGSRPGHAFKYLSAIQSIIAVCHCRVSHVECDAYGDETELRDELFPRAPTSRGCHQLRAMFRRFTGSVAMILKSRVFAATEDARRDFYSRTTSSILFHKIVIENEASPAGRRGIFNSFSSLLGA